MALTIEEIEDNELSLWDSYVLNHPESNLYHLTSWRDVISQTYGHSAIYIAAKNNSRICGVLPTIRIKHFIFGDSLTSIPFFDSGGILADTPEIEKLLLKKICSIGSAIKTHKIELRSLSKLKDFDKDSSISKIEDWKSTVQTNKVCMRLQLSASSEEMMKSFKSKLRSQIKKPIKEGLTAKIGSAELIDDFYKVFLVNMRDLGSPVHSKELIENTLKIFKKSSRLVIVYRKTKPVAGSVIIGFKNVLMNPWASSLREYSKLSPNMLLYWAMLEYGCDNGFKYFDFGRSTPGEGTYNFKKQWGATPLQLYWHYLSVDENENQSAPPSKFDKAIELWKKLPVPLTGYLGPHVRKYISL